MMWARLVGTALGIWLMVAPAVLGYGGSMAISDRITGPIVASVGIMAIAEVLRPLRRINTIAGAWLVVAPWVLGAPTAAAAANGVAVGVALVGASFIRGRVRHRIGGGWSALWRPPESADASG